MRRSLLIKNAVRDNDVEMEQDFVCKRDEKSTWLTDWCMTAQERENAAWVSVVKKD